MWSYVLLSRYMFLYVQCGVCYMVSNGIGVIVMGVELDCEAFVNGIDEGDNVNNSSSCIVIPILRV
jgi:hypothetical protein